METHFLLLTLLFSLLFNIPLSIAQAPQSLYVNCDNSIGNFTSNSTFQTNLNSLLSGLTSNASTSGYSAGSLGTIPDHVYGLVLCRGDASREACRTCLSAASHDILDACPFRKGATIWYDNCQLRYSSRRFAATVDNGFRVFMSNTQNVSSEWPRFNESLVRLLNGLTRYSAYNTTAAPRLFGTGEIPVNGESPKLYALVQCTRDLTPDDCNQCLNTVVQDLPKCCNKKIGGRVLASNCNFRYETYKLFSGTSKLQFPGVPNASVLTPGPAIPPVLPPTFNSIPPNNPTDQKGSKNHTGTILVIVIPVGAAILLISLICCTFWRKQKKATQKYRKTATEELISMDALLLDLLTIRNVTNNFSESNKLGEGGFGAVYKGTLPDGQEIAAKRLSRGSGQGVDELKNEVVLLAKLQHRNLVRLLGVCLEEEEKILVYEYVQNLSLEKILFDPSKKDQLPWERRYKIINGIARGMLYLHEESQVKIIHRDLKASNILLDADLNSKISDFGLARLFGEDQTQANTTRVVGTYGYMSPEYAMRGQFSNKSDVFSFGVLVLEIVTGRRNNDNFSSENSTDLLAYAWKHWLDGTVSYIVDPSFGGNYSQTAALRCVQIGLLCVQEAPADRPTMSAISLMLNSYSISVRVPSRPAFVVRYNRTDSLNNDKFSDNSEGTTKASTTKSKPYTPNELSITELDPR